MPTVFPRRRAGRFAHLVDQPRQLRRHTPADHDLAGLANLADHLRQTDPAPRPDPAFAADLRAMLVAAGERDGIGATAKPAPAPAPAPAPSCHRRRYWRATAVGVAAGIAGAASLSAASSGSVPGDTLYGLKRSTEEARLVVTMSDVDRGALYLDFARRRMQEADAVSGNPAEIHGILADMDSDTRLGVKLLTTAAVTSRDPAPLNTVSSFLTAQAADMPEMMADVTGAAHGRAIDSKNLLDGVRIRIRWLRTDLACTTLQPADELGPTPQSCSPTATVPPRSPTPAEENPAPQAAPTQATAAPTPTKAAPAAAPSPPAPPSPPPAPAGVTPTPTQTPPLVGPIQLDVPGVELQFLPAPDDGG